MTSSAAASVDATDGAAKPVAPTHQVELFDLSNPRARQDLLAYETIILAMTNEAFYRDREKKASPKNVRAALLNADAVILVFSDEDQSVMACMVGNIRWHFSGCNVFIDDVITRPPYQRNGIQSKMMETMEGFARRQMLERMTLYTESENAAARGSYEKGGFEVRSVDDGDITIVMIKDL